MISLINIRDKMPKTDLLVIFVILWLSVVCRVCLANEVVLDSLPSEVNHCQQSAENKHENNSNKLDCAERCEVGSITVPAKFENQVAQVVKQQAPDGEFAVIVDLFPALQSIIYLSQHIPRYDRPERAYQIPFERYTVLLN